jgi:hypothetical protein
VAGKWVLKRRRLGGYMRGLRLVEDKTEVGSEVELSASFGG